MKCPRCKATVIDAPDASGLILCAGCGARLRSRPPAVPKATTAAESDGPGAAPAAKPRAPQAPAVPKAGSETLPPVPARIDAPSDMGTVLAEIRALRAVQDEILSLLRERPAEPVGGVTLGPDDTVPPPAPVVRSRRRKAVLVIDDDDQSRAAAVTALESGDDPVRAAPTRHAGL